MTEAELKRDAEGAVNDVEPDGSKFHAKSIIENFNGGSLVIVEYDDEDGDDVESFVYYLGERRSVYADAEGLARSVADKSKPTFWSLALDPSKIGGVSGIVALIITIAICWRYTAEGSNLKVPEVLANAWTIIIGFYFGSQTKKLA